MRSGTGWAVGQYFACPICEQGARAPNYTKVVAEPCAAHAAEYQAALDHLPEVEARLKADADRLWTEALPEMARRDILPTAPLGGQTVRARESVLALAEAGCASATAGRIASGDRDAYRRWSVRS